MRLNDVAIVSVKVNDYRIYFGCISKDETINLLKNNDFLKNWNIIKYRFHMQKIGKEIVNFGD